MDIPEIRAEVFKYLGAIDSYQCSQVCKDWNDEISTYPPPSLIKAKKISEFKKLFNKYKKKWGEIYINLFTSRTKPFLDKYLDELTIESIEIYDEMGDTFFDSEIKYIVMFINVKTSNNLRGYVLFTGSINTLGKINDDFFNRYTFHNIYKKYDKWIKN